MRVQAVLTPKEIHAQYQSDQKRRDTLQGNDKDACIADAKTRYGK